MATKGNLKRSKQRSWNWPQVIGLGLSLLVFFLPYFMEFEGLSPAGHRAFSIFMVAVVLWVTEAIPLHATAALIIFLQILLLSDRAMLPFAEGAFPEGMSAPRFASFYAALANPVIMLFLGGFFLADASAKYRLDRNLARVMLRPFGTKPRNIMLGMMLITALLSMFMSNTATTATMMAVVIPVLLTLPEGDRMKTGLALSIPFAANVGGIGTPVGTPPNAIALGALQAAGISVSFLQWMALAVPCVLIILLFAWQLLCRIFPSSVREMELRIDSSFDTSRPAIIFYFTAAVTILLWLTEPIHGVSSSIVGFFPVVMLLSTGVFTTKDLQSIQWHVLWLVAGGIALGVGVTSSGLDKWFLSLVHWDQITPILLTSVFCLVAIALSTVISNSATANLIIPIGMSLAMSGAVHLSPLEVSFFIAIGASLAMALPISTPPNAIAYSTGAVKTKDMALAGILIGLFGLVLFVWGAPLLWKVLGILPS